MLSLCFFCNKSKEIKEERNHIPTTTNIQRRLCLCKQKKISLAVTIYLFKKQPANESEGIKEHLYFRMTFKKAKQNIH